MSTPSSRTMFSPLMIHLFLIVVRCFYVFSADPTSGEAPVITVCLIRARVW
ncbi:hypothetical protein CGRA01v4_06965 [Colletotrichum graminicola]|nr:hypothetical protein CGRA01v4_06965 [Colletotrichum graminicola]